MHTLHGLCHKLVLDVLREGGKFAAADTPILVLVADRHDNRCDHICGSPRESYAS